MDELKILKEKLKQLELKQRIENEKEEYTKMARPKKEQPTEQINPNLDGQDDDTEITQEPINSEDEQTKILKEILAVLNDMRALDLARSSIYQPPTEKDK